MNTLNKFRGGSQIRIQKIICSDQVCRRLGELGLYVEAEIQIIKNDHLSPIILKIFDSQIALGRAEAQNIYGIQI